MATKKKVEADQPGVVVGMLALMIKAQTEAALKTRGRSQRAHLLEILKFAEVLGGLGAVLNEGESIEPLALSEPAKRKKSRPTPPAKKRRWPEDRVLAEARLLARRTVGLPDDKSQKLLTLLLEKGGWNEVEFIAAVDRERASRRKKKG